MNAGRKPPSGRLALLLIPLGVLAAVLALLPLFTTRNSDEIAGLETYSFTILQHARGTIKYDTDPPAGGPHYPEWQNCGIYRQPIRNELAVHSLEHGAVWIAYRPGIDKLSLEALRRLVRGRSHTLLSPYPGLDGPAVAVAWNRRLKVDDATDPRLATFLQRFHQGAQTPEPGAPCRGGTGRPDE